MRSRAAQPEELRPSRQPGVCPPVQSAGSLPAQSFTVIETVPPAEMAAALAADAAQKAHYGTIHLIIRGFLCTPFLAYGASTVFIMVAAGVPLAVAGLVFPAGYVTLSFLGLEMATGSFALMPIGMYAGTTRRWSWFATGPGLNRQPPRRHILRLAALVLMDLRRVRGAPCSGPRGSCSSSFPRPPSTRSSISVRRPRLVRRRWHGCPL